MCGIIGYYSLDKKSPEIIKKFNEACSVLEKRGPDQSGTFIGKNILIGNTRLSIVSKKKIVLPFQKHDYIISFNGEIFNHKEIRNSLISNGYSFSTDTDTEVILSAYHFYKLDFVNKLRGFFAIAIYDRPQKKVILARDRFGNKPLYYNLKDNKLIFCSTQSALITSELVKFEPNEKRFNDFIIFGDIAGQETLHKNILELEPSNMAIFDGKKLKKQKYYHLEYIINNKIRTINDSENQSLIQLTNLFENSFKVWSDNNYGDNNILLSGGLDSGLLSLITNKTSKIKNTFTLNFNDNKYLNEIDDAKKLSKKIKANNFPINISQKSVYDNIFEIYSNFDEPVPDTSLLMYKISEVLSKKYGTRVCLTGDGADEIFGGYKRHLMIKEKFTRTKKIQDIALSLNYLSVNRLKKFLNITNYKVPSERLKYLEKVKNFDILNIILLYDLKYYLPQFLKSNDRVGMNFSLEFRSPYTDHILVESAFSIRSRLKINNKVHKYILQCMFNKINKSKKKNIKKYFCMPYKSSDFYNGFLKSLFLDTINNNSKLSGFYSTDGLKRLLLDHKINNDHANTLFRFLALELFLKSKY